MTVTPLVSVVLAARNASGALPRSLRSLVSQTMPDWECILVDDGSSDCIEDVAAIDGRIRVVRQDAAGLTLALRRGVSEARGEYVARLDADDECLPGRLYHQSQVLSQRTEVVAVGCGVETVSKAGGVLSQHIYPTEHIELVAALDLLQTPIPHSTLMVRRKTLEKVGSYRSVFYKAQDYDLLRRLSEVGKLSSLAEIFVRLTLSGQSITMSPDGGDQFEFGVLAFVSSVLRAKGIVDPIESAACAEFIREFRDWYRESRLPASFRSRLERRSARIAVGEGRAMSVVAGLARATWFDPTWPLSALGVEFDLAAGARVWAENWIRRHT